MRAAHLGLLALALSVSACGNDDEENPPRLAVPNDGLGTMCHPFRTHDTCGVPYPSDYWQVADATTSTGYRQNLPSELLPASARSGNAFDPGRWNVRDGFSPATPIVAYFEEKLDASSLPSQHGYDESTKPSSATLIVDMDTMKPIPHFAELDMAADIEPTERQPLIIRPAYHLEPGHHYAVGITDSLKTLDGTTPARPPGFASALSGAEPRNADEERLLAALPATLAALASVGVQKNDLLLAWDFHTASLEQSTKTVLSMRDQVLEQVGDAGMGFAITSVETDPNAEILTRIRGTFAVPSFLSSDDRTIAETHLVFDDQGKPVVQRVADYPFELIIPKSAVDNGPYPLLVYGHGLLGAADQVSSGHVRQFCNDKGYICVGTDWIGLSETEDVGVGQNAAAVDGVQDINRIPYVTDRLQQAIVNFIALARTAKTIATGPKALLPNGSSALVDPPTTYYYGISQGGIMGASLMAYTPDIERGVVQVGGSAYSLMIQRSVNWNQFFPAIRNAYGDRVDQHLLMALWQPLFDDSEGSGTAYAQGSHDPLPGTQKKHLLMEIAVGDSQVSNLAAEIQARTMNIPLLVPSALDVWGLDTTTGGADNAIAFWDLGREKPPETNATPAEDNDVHGDIRKLPQNQEQTDTFLKTGKAENPCGGPCSFPGWTP